MLQVNAPISLLPAFSDPVSDSQYVFRSLLKSMAEPGMTGDIPESSRQKLNDSKLYSSSWSIARALFDYDTLVYISPELGSESVIRSIQFQTDARITNDLSKADFALVTLSELTRDNPFKKGTIERPHESCTLIIQVDEIDLEGAQIEISGPGIEHARQLSIAGLETEQMDAITLNQALYPCGLDFIFCTRQTFIALPRTTAISGIARTKGDSVCM